MNQNSFEKQRKIHLFQWVSTLSYIYNTIFPPDLLGTAYVNLVDSNHSWSCHLWTHYILSQSDIHFFQSLQNAALCRNGRIFGHCWIQTDENEKPGRNQNVSSSYSHACGCTRLCGWCHDYWWVVWNVPSLIYLFIYFCGYCVFSEFCSNVISLLVHSELSF